MERQIRPQITKGQVMSFLSSFFRYDGQKNPREREQVSLIINEVCRFYGADRDGVLSRSRQPKWIWPRHVAMAVASANGFTSRTIGEVMHRERSIVSYASKTVLDQCDVYPEIASEVREISKKVKQQIRKIEFQNELQ